MKSIDVQVKIKGKHSRLAPDVWLSWNWKTNVGKSEKVLCYCPLKVLD